MTSLSTIELAETDSERGYHRCPAECAFQYPPIPSRSIGKFRSHRIAIDMQMTKVVGAIGVSGWLWKSKAAEKLEADAPSVDRSITNAAKAESPAQPSHDRWGSRPSSLARAELQ